MEARVELEQNDDEYPSIISSYGNSMTIGKVEKINFIIGFIIIFYSSINMIIFFIIPIYRLQKNKSEFPNASYKTIEKRIIVIHFILHTFGILSGLFTILYNFTENLSKCNSIFFGLIMFCSLVALSLWIVEILFGFIYTTKYKSTITFDQLTRIMAELRENSFIFIYTKGVDHSFICSKSCSLVETTCYSKKGVVFPLKLYLNSTNNELKLLPKVFDLTIVQEIKMSNEIKDHFQNVMNNINNCDSDNEKAFDFYPSISGDYIVSDGKSFGGLVYDTTKGDSELFEEKRIIGENDNYVCKLIREDMIEEFIVFVNKNGFTLWSQIEFSIFETNLYLIENNPTVIEYAAFFGSTQIFKYLYLNGCELTPSLWLYSIHGNNQEIIHILEENKIKPKDETYIECYNEAIKCHHNEMAEYFCKNFLDNKTIDDINHLSKSIKYSNFHFFPKNFKDNFAFHELCHFNYYWYVNYLIETEKIDINEKIIFKSFLFLNEVSNYIN